MAEWLKATDCKSVHESVRWFESTPAHQKASILKGTRFFERIYDKYIYGRAIRIKDRYLTNLVLKLYINNIKTAS